MVETWTSSASAVSEPQDFGSVVLAPLKACCRNRAELNHGLLIFSFPTIATIDEEGFRQKLRRYYGNRNSTRLPCTLVQLVS